MPFQMLGKAGNQASNEGLSFGVNRTGEMVCSDCTEKLYCSPVRPEKSERQRQRQRQRQCHSQMKMQPASHATSLNPRVRRFAETIQTQGAKALYVHLDVTREAERAAEVRRTISRFGHIDVQVNNAAVLIGKGIQEASFPD
ncbi:SDR family NAD(P)-dependent oxidoreductase [Variovorax ureilyticus]|uniref:SDR family NAD(P)-dependent oxidoreductase n=1 Tax=Variovorax ureilyticus TaxID=1836198 RepID=UPI003BF4BCD1